MIKGLETFDPGNNTISTLQTSIGSQKSLISSLPNEILL